MEVSLKTEYEVFSPEHPAPEQMESGKFYRFIAKFAG